MAFNYHMKKSDAKVVADALIENTFELLGIAKSIKDTFKNNNTSVTFDDNQSTDDFVATSSNNNMLVNYQNNMIVLTAHPMTDEEKEEMERQRLAGISSTEFVAQKRIGYIIGR